MPETQRRKRSAGNNAPRLAGSPWSCKNQVWLEAQQVAAGFLQMRFATLHLLREGANVAHAALEWASIENGTCAGNLPGRVGDGLGLVNGKGRGHADVH